MKTRAFNIVPDAGRDRCRERAIASFCLHSLWVKSQNYSDRDAIPKRSVLHPTYCPGPLRASRVRAPTHVGRSFALFPSMKFGKLGKKVAQFRQINMGKPCVHHDALEFPDGEIVLLTRMCEGQHATVLQLPASGRPLNAAEGQKRDSLVR